MGKLRFRNENREWVEMEIPLHAKRAAIHHGRRSLKNHQITKTKTTNLMKNSNYSSTGLIAVWVLVYVAVEDDVAARQAVGINMFVAAGHREFADHGHACRYAQEQRVYVVPPLVRGGTAHYHNLVDGQCRSDDADTDAHQSTEERRHLLQPALLQFIACILYNFSHIVSCD